MSDEEFGLLVAAFQIALFCLAWMMDCRMDRAKAQAAKDKAA